MSDKLQSDAQYGPMVTASFRDRESAERAYESLAARGYSNTVITACAAGGSGPVASYTEAQVRTTWSVASSA